MHFTWRADDSASLPAQCKHLLLIVICELKVANSETARKVKYRENLFNANFPTQVGLPSSFCGLLIKCHANRKRQLIDYSLN
uniref:Uncharacterized protein n=1 Tax=Octopus bimaculoides TaxID=37653 RepID=A0A0L8HZ75_OCTBM